MENPPSDEIERLLLDLKDDRRDVRSRAAYELGKHDDPRILMPLVSALSDNDKFVRSWAAGALGKSGAPAVAPLISILEGPDPTVGYYAALALGEIGDLRAIPMLAQAICKGDYDIRPSAAGALIALGDADALPDRVLSDPNLTPPQRVRILESLRDVVYSDEQLQVHYRLPDVFKYSTQRLASDDERVRAGAQETMDALQTRTLEVPEDVAAPDSQSVASSAPAAEPRAIEPQHDVPEAARPKRGLWSRLLGK